MPGNFIVKAAQSPFLPGEFRAVGIPALPTGLTPTALELKYTYQDLKPVEGAPYLVLFDDGTQAEGKLDANGEARIDNPPGPGRVFFGYDAREAFPYPERPANPIFGFVPNSPEDASEALERYARAEAEYMADNYFPDEVAAIYGGQAEYEDLIHQYDYFEEAEPHEDDGDDGPGTHREVLIAGDDGGAEDMA